MRGHWFALQSNQWFFTKKETEKSWLSGQTWRRWTGQRRWTVRTCQPGPDRNHPLRIWSPMWRPARTWRSILKPKNFRGPVQFAWRASKTTHHWKAGIACFVYLDDWTLNSLTASKLNARLGTRSITTSEISNTSSTEIPSKAWRCTFRSITWNWVKR